LNNKNNTQPCFIKFRAVLISIFCLSAFTLPSQNKLEKQLFAENIETIVINGNQIFNILVSTSKTNKITIYSKLDGEYQDQFHLITQQQNDSLKLNLKRLPFTSKIDDKRNAHKVVAAALHLEIPDGLNLSINSDIGSVKLNGDFNSLSVELYQGHAEVSGSAKNATINTLSGYIYIATKNADIKATSNNGKVKVDEFNNVNSYWKLKSINGNITVKNQY